MTILMVSYPQHDGARFDRDYYVSTHLPLVREKWSGHGLLSAGALLPNGDASVAGVALLEFSSDAAIDAALASPEAGPVFADLPNFTDIEPIVARCERV